MHMHTPNSIPCWSVCVNGPPCVCVYTPVCLCLCLQTLDNFRLFEQFYLDYYYNTDQASGYYEDYGLPGTFKQTTR